MCVCVCPLSCQTITALQPTTTAALLSAFSPALVSSRHAITLSNETGVNASQAASCKHTVPGSITSLFLSLSSSFLPLSRLACTICGNWVDECGGMERDWKTVLLSHSNWGKNLAYVLMHALPRPLLSLFLCLTVSQYSRLYVFLSIILFSLPSVVLLLFFLSLAVFLF